jgi:ABC-type antimicrobial peptide transport system permease subunit
MIGVASITMIFALSSGAMQIVNKQITALDDNVIVIRPGKISDPLSGLAQPNRNYATSTLVESDLTYIKNAKHVKAVSPLMILSGTIRADSIAPSSSQIVATTPDLQTIAKFKIAEGQFLDDSIAKNTAIIGTQLSVNIFGTELSIGRTATVKGKPFTVIGVLKRINDPINYNAVDFDNAIIINYEMGKVLNQTTPQIQQINASVDSTSNLNAAADNLKQIIKSNHAGENDFSILTREQISKPTNQLLYVITNLSTALAAISLIVGGIGIMNIMLVTVAERTREIGIRKALGASNADILYQFLIESLAISITGGIFGFILGCMSAFLISTFLTFDPIITWQNGLAAIVVSVAVGVVFGIYPAARAARKDPIESLYQYR